MKIDPAFELDIILETIVAESIQGEATVDAYVIDNSDDDMKNVRKQKHLRIGPG